MNFGNNRYWIDHQIKWNEECAICSEVVENSIWSCFSKGKIHIRSIDNPTREQVITCPLEKNDEINNLLFAEFSHQVWCASNRGNLYIFDSKVSIISNVVNPSRITMDVSPTNTQCFVLFETTVW